MLRSATFLRAALYVDMARRLQARQLAGRLRRALPPRLLAVSSPLGTPRWAGLAAGLGAVAAPQSGPTPAPHLARAFHAFGCSRAADSPTLWSDPQDGLLFLFGLHDFSALARYAAGPGSAAGDEFWGSLVEGWLDSHASPRLPAWHPYPTSGRIIAWASAIGALGHWSPSLRDRVAASIGRQARYLRRAVEHDIGGNHVLRNAAGLIFAGAVLPDSGLLAPGLRLARRELGRQILADGGHEERSPSYHREILQDLTSVAVLLDRCGRPSPPWLDDARRRMGNWLAAMAGPDGALPLLNDAWAGPPVLGAAGPSVRTLSPSGYVVLRSPADHLLFDAGPLCPPHLPPHAHADALSLVMWADGRPLIVDPGSFTYTGAERDVFRSTGAHNTVEVDGENQCLFWGDFRAGALPVVQPPQIRKQDGLVVVASSHDGYRRLPDPVLHERLIVWWPGVGTVVADRLGARQTHQVRSRLHLAPGLELKDGRVGPCAVEALGALAGIGRADAWYSPYLGTRHKIAALVQEGVVSPGRPFGWSLLRPPAQVALFTGSQLVLECAGERRTVTLW